MMTTIAVILNAHPIVTILRYRHSEPKLFVTHEVIVSEDDEDVNKMPYEAQLEDSGRLLVVKTY